MIAIQIADYFIIRQDHEAEEANLLNLLIWLAGFVIYRILMRVDTPVGSTLPTWRSPWYCAWCAAG